MKKHKGLTIVLLLMPALLLCIYLYCNNIYYKESKPEIKEGILDLGGWDQERFPYFQLSGEWEIYPGCLLDVEGIKSNYEKRIFESLPFSLKESYIYGQKFPASDIATFRIHVVGSRAGSDLAIRIRQMTAAYRLYVDDELIAKNGQMDDGSEAVLSEYRYNTVRLTPQNNDFDIIIHTANQFDTKGLLHWPIEIGDYDGMEKSNHIVSVISYLTAGAIIILIIFLFVFWLNVPKEKELLLLSVFGITTLIRVLINQDILIADILPELPVLALANLDYSAAFAIQYLAPASMLAAYRDLYPKRIMDIILIYTLVPVVWTWAEPISMHSYISSIFDYAMIPIFIYTCIILARAVGKDRPGSGVLLVMLSCVIVLMFTSFAAANNYIIYYLLSGSGFGFCFIIFIQCYLVSKRLKEALYLELSALKGQIRPHFIYNSLATIIAISRTDSERSRDLLIDFSKYLRGAFDYTNVDFISIEQELEFVRAYVALEKARFKDKYKVLYHLEAGNFLVPPLILQPLVENAFIHGLRCREEGGTVTIYTTRRNKVVRIGVKDDGAGANVENLKDIEQKGIGINNINRRLLKLYDCQLQFNIPENGGFEVYMEIPYKEAVPDECNTG